MPSHSVQFSTKRSNSEVPGVQDIDPKDVWENKTQLTIIDVRRPDEFTGELGHVPGSKLLVLDTLPQRLTEIPTTQPVVFVCRSGSRSARAAAFAEAHGITNCYNMQGGMIAWNKMNYEVEGRS